MPVLQPWAQNRLQHFQDEQGHLARAECQGEVIGVQRSKRKELPCGWPKQAERQNGGNGGKHRGQGPVLPSKSRQQ